MRKTLGFLVLVFAASGLGAARETRTLLVFPFENQGSRPDLNWISESFPEILASRLSGPNRYALEREERNAAYAELEIPPGTSPLMLASEYKVAEILGVDWAVVGSFSVEGQRLRARAQLLDMRRPRLAPALEVTGELADLVELQTQLAWRLLATSDPDFTVGKEEDFRRRFPLVRLDAFENYVRGVLETDDESRVRFLREADRLSPADHRAAFELGRHFFNHKDYANSANWLRKMVPADRDYLESLFLAGVDDFFMGKEAEAEKAFAALVEKTPLSEVSNNLGVMETRRGRYAEAFAHFERAYEADSRDFDFCLNLGLSLWYLKRYDEAARRVAEAVRADGEDPAAHALLALLGEKLGDADGKRRELEWLAEHEGGSAEKSTENILPQARLKKNYEGRGFRLLSLALANPQSPAGEPAGRPEGNGTAGGAASHGPFPVKTP